MLQFIQENILSKISYDSPVILSFSLISLIVLWLNAVTKGSSNKMLFSVYRSPRNSLPAYIRVFTHILGHSSFSHYIDNFMIILLVGPICEQRYGSTNLLILILITAFITGIINITFFPKVRLLGASGISFMLIILSSTAIFSHGSISLTLIIISILYIGKEVIDGIFLSDNTSHMSHIIGGICGCIGGFILK